MLKRWKEYFEKLMNKENDREPRKEEVEVVKEEVNCVSREEWRRSVLIPIYKNKGDAQCCGKYKEIKIMNHTIKVWERIIEFRLRDSVKISKQQYRFMLERELPTPCFPQEC